MRRATERILQRIESMTDSLITRKAAAKINLTLAVLGLRDDGFHEIESWVVKIDLHDELRFGAADTLSMTITGDHGALPTNESNLVIKAAKLLASDAGIDPKARITLDKRIPAEAGLGGGSSDAAAALLGLNEMWGIGLPIERLLQVAARIGSDVPLFLHDGSVVIRGRGELIEQVPLSRGYWIGLIAPGFGLPTADVYRAFDKRLTRGDLPTRPWMAEPGAARSLSESLFNDLTVPAMDCQARLGMLIEKIERAGGRRVHMTGSGSGLFAIFDDRDEAQSWDDKVAAILSPDDRHDIVHTID